MAISMIPKIKDVIDKYPLEFLDEFKSRMIKFVVLFSFI